MNGSEQTLATTDSAVLSRFDIQSLLKELLRRGNEALQTHRNGEAERLYRAVLGYSPRDGMLLQAVAELALVREDWTEAAACAGRALETPLMPHAFVRACTIACCAAFRLGGEAAARPILARFLDKLETTLARPDIASHEHLNLAVYCAMSIGDLDLAHRFFRKRYAGVVTDQFTGMISECVTTKEWCERNGALFRMIDPPQRITSAGLPAVARPWDFTTTGTAMAVIPGGELVSGMDFVFTPTGEMLEDSGHLGASSGTGWFPRVHSAPMARMFHAWTDDVTTVDADALFLSCSQGMHVGHWLVDHLPRLRGLAGRPDLKVAIPTELPVKCRDFLPLFGVGNDRIINCDLGKRYRFRNLVIMQGGAGVLPEPQNICFVTEALRTPAAAHGRRIYLERGVNTRAVTNHAAFYAELDRLKFERLSLADLSIAEQRAALSAADVVIATYGSDLLAFYMMNEGSHLIELNWDPPALDAGAAATCSMVGVYYHMVSCPAAENTAHRLLKKDKDFAVDIAALRSVLAGAGVAAAEHFQIGS